MRARTRVLIWQGRLRVHLLALFHQGSLRLGASYMSTEQLHLPEQLHVYPSSYMSTARISLLSLRRTRAVAEVQTQNQTTGLNPSSLTRHLDAELNRFEGPALAQKFKHDDSTGRGHVQTACMYACLHECMYACMLRIFSYNH